MASNAVRCARELWMVVGKPDELSPAGIKQHLRAIASRVSSVQPQVAKLIVREYFVITSLLHRSDIYSVSTVMFGSGTDDVFCEARSTIVGCGCEAAALVLANARNLHLVLKSWTKWPIPGGLLDLGSGVMNIMNDLNKSLGSSAYSYDQISNVRDEYVADPELVWSDAGIGDLVSIYAGYQEQVVRMIRDIAKKNGKNWARRQK